MHVNGSKAVCIFEKVCGRLFLFRQEEELDCKLNGIALIHTDE